MMPTSHLIRAYCFGPYRLNVAERLLERDGRRVPLTPKAVDTLLAVVAEAGRLVSVERLMSEVWPDVTVVVSGLTRNICVLRKELSVGMQDTIVIETIPKRGYRFVAQVHAELAPGETSSLKPHVADPPLESFTVTAGRRLLNAFGAIWRSSPSLRVNGG